MLLSGCCTGNNATTPACRIYSSPSSLTMKLSARSSAATTLCCILLLLLLRVIPGSAGESLITEDAGVVSDSNTQEEAHDNKQRALHDNNHQECGLYLAPSTIPGAGLGLFVTNPLQPGDLVPGSGDVAIPLIDFTYHRGRDEFFNMFSSYTWDGVFMGMGGESDAENDIYAHAPGLNSAINCNMALINVGREFPEYDVQNAMELSRYESPGSGAYSPYFNGTTLAEAPIPAGGELFKYYGKRYFMSREEEYGKIAFPEDYAEADAVCDIWGREIERTDAVKDALWIIALAVMKAVDERYYHALPATPALARKCAQNGIRSLHQPAATRSISDLQQTGRCQDNIRHGPSTIPHAARGAFATRSLKEGTIVAGTPLLHIPKRDFVYMYALKFDKKDNTWKRIFEERTGTQLLVNYCWGHVDSTILVCPYGTGVSYINHSNKKPNVKVQWAPDGMMGHNASWVELSHLNMYQTTINLAMDFVALRDIAEGEEILVDYGDSWEAVWQQHAHEYWEENEAVGQQDDVHSYAPAAVWNVKMAQLPLKTVEEQQYEPYPKNLLLKCHVMLRKERYVELLRDLGDNLWQVRDTGMECNILNRRRQQHGDYNYYLYTVEFELKVTTNGETRYIVISRDHVPRTAFRFMDVAYTTDIHSQAAFRYPAQVPERMVSKAWRNDIGRERYLIY